MRFARQDLVTVPDQAPPTSVATSADLTMHAPDARRDTAVFEALATGDLRSLQVTRVLQAAFEFPDGADAWSLASTERQAALLRLALSYGDWPVWFTTRCVACGELIDLSVRNDEFSVTAPDAPIPAELEVHLDGQTRRFAVPSGYHEMIAEVAAYDPELAVLRACAQTGPEISVADAPAWQQAFDAAVAPVLSQVQTDLRFDCPHCGEETSYWFDPLDWIARHAAQCFDQVHILARGYGWSEQDILAMSPARQSIYLSLLQRAGA